MNEQQLREQLVRVDERFSHTVRYTEQEMAAFATLTLDRNPLHHDPDLARKAGFDGAIASGQHTTAIMMGLLATHFSRNDDGVAREMLCLNVNFAFKQPVLADQDLKLEWVVRIAEWHAKLGGMLTHLDGSATLQGANVAPSVVARATILVKPGR